MARLPPPPVVGRGQARVSSAAGTDSDAARAEAAAGLPSSVTDLPEAWMVKFAAPPVVAPPGFPPPSSLGVASTDEAEWIDDVELRDEEATSAVAARNDEPVEVVATANTVDPSLVVESRPSFAPPVSLGPSEPPVSFEVPAAFDPPVGEVAGEAAGEIAIATASVVDPPAVVATNTAAGGDQVRAAPRLRSAAKPAPATGVNRRNLFAVGGVLGVALVAVLIARCGGDGATPADTIAAASPRDGIAAASSPVGDDASAVDRPGPAAADVQADAQAPGSAAQAAAEPTSAGDAAPTNAKPDDAATTDAEPAAGAAASDEPPGDRDADAAADAAAGADAAPSPLRDPSPTSSKSKSSAGRSDKLPPSAAPSADVGLTAAENLDKARVAWKAGNAKDTYKYANKSRYKEPNAEATELATLAACKMKLDDAAKSSFKQLSGERKKRTRGACRDFGVRVGL